MKILAVSERENGVGGVTADLSVEIKPGNGRVFLESFPLSRIDTQLSTRFATEIACREMEANCENLDFFYTISADTSLIEGPSAGAAAAVLTAAGLEGLNVDKDITITGTINSGSLIGPVGGLKEKIIAASNAHIKKVLIPQGERLITNKSNSTTDIVEFGKEKGVEVIEVSDLREALYQFTGKKFDAEENITLDQSYLNTMSLLAESLCNKSASFENKIYELKDNATLESAKSLTEKGIAAFNKKEFYASASYCFGANVNYQYLTLSGTYTKEQLKAHSEKIREAAKKVESAKVKIATITDLQSFTSMKERVLETYENLNLSIKNLEENKTREGILSLAYAEERLFSAVAWSKFLGTGGKKLVLENKSLESSCRTKIAEAEERYEYRKLLTDTGIYDARKDIDSAYLDLNEGNYELCLSKAAKAKAESDVVVSTLGSSLNLTSFIDKKIELSRRAISRSISKGVFPILGYSYYEYANSLKNSDPYSALLYSEYALELSDMDSYFGTTAPTKIENDIGIIDLSLFIWFSVGFTSGGLLVFLIFRLKGRERTKRVFAKRTGINPGRPSFKSLPGKKR